MPSADTKMKFSIIAAVTLLATIASASNSFTKPLAGDKVRAGDDLLMKWTADTPGPVDIKLYKGEDGNLKEEDQIVMLETNQGNYTWKVPKDKKPGKVSFDICRHQITLSLSV